MQHAHPAGRYCVVGANRFACRVLRGEGQLSVGEWLRSWLGARQLLFAWDDPAPAFARIVRHVWSLDRQRSDSIVPRSLADPFKDRPGG